MATVRPSRILLLTNVERGEANIFLATCHALVQREPGVEIHFATFAGFEEPVASAWQHARRAVPEAKPFVYHRIRGLSMSEGLRAHFATSRVPCRGDYLPESFVAPLGFWTTMRAIRDAMRILTPYDGAQLVDVFSSIVAIIHDVAADLVVVDTLMSPALTACYHLGVRFACLSPNTLKDFAVRNRLQFPALFSGFPYPVPWHLIPLNVFFMLYGVVSFLADSHRRRVKAYLRTHAGAVLRTPLDLALDPPPQLRVLVGTLPELDFPVVPPPHMEPCGPIIRSAAAVSDADAELAGWLARGPTLYINLGSLCRTAEDQASELALALRIVLDSAGRQPDGRELQVLWKLSKLGEYQAAEPGSRIHGLLGREMQADRVRVVDWVRPEPISMLGSGHVVCSVHHGGANSFNEAVVAGVPQVVLPQWTDTYDFALRVERLGVGRLGSRTAKPRWAGPELAAEVLRVVAGPAAAAMRVRARELAALCAARGGGADTAARAILAEARAGGHGGRLRRPHHRGPGPR